MISIARIFLAATPPSSSEWIPLEPIRKKGSAPHRVAESTETAPSSVPSEWIELEQIQNKALPKTTANPVAAHVVRGKHCAQFGSASEYKRLSQQLNMVIQTA